MSCYINPRSPPNTGNIIRLCANVGAALHLIRPLAFDLDDRRLRRAGLDYREWATVQVHDSLEAFEQAAKPPRLLGFSTKASRCYVDLRYQPGDALLFGPETRGLPSALLCSLPEGHALRIPMRAGNRSLNLSNAVAVVLYEAWRQHRFA